MLVFFCDDSFLKEISIATEVTIMKAHLTEICQKSLLLFKEETILVKICTVRVIALNCQTMYLKLLGKCN